MTLDPAQLPDDIATLKAMVIAGTTEAATVALLNHYGVSLDLAVLAAIAMRLGSIWVAMLVGFLSMVVLERRRAQMPGVCISNESRALLVSQPPGGLPTKRLGGVSASAARSILPPVPQ